MDRYIFNIRLAGATRSKNITVPKLLVSVFRMFSFIVLFISLIGILQFSLHSYDKISYKSSLKSRQSLKKQLSFLNTKLDSLDKQLQISFKDETLIYNKYGMNAPDKGEKKLGVGGKLNLDSLLYFKTNPVQDLRKDVELKSDHLNRQLIRNERSYGVLKGFLEQKFTNWRHIPSISPTAGRFSSRFGTRTHPVTGERDKMHAGIDISNSRWTPIFATADGLITEERPSQTFGNYVEIDHGNGFVTKYGHMHQSRARKGQFVRRGDLIGYQGNTGRSTGNHLHYEVHFNNKPQNPMNYILPDSFSVE